MLRLVMGQWTAYILWILRAGGSVRFGILKRQLEGISAKVLTERLRMLEEYDIIYRDVRPTRPPEVSYGLTDRGEELVATLIPLYELACRWYKQDNPSLENMANGAVERAVDSSPSQPTEVAAVAFPLPDELASASVPSFSG